MEIRESVLSDANELQSIQRKCIAGTGLRVTTVNEPDFFLRSQIYENTKTFVACNNGKILGTCSAAIKMGMINNQKIKQGYVYQAFTSPDSRRTGVAKKLICHVNSYMEENNVDLASALVLEGNEASIRWLGLFGYQKIKTFANPYISTYKEMPLKDSEYHCISAKEEDLKDICVTMNRMWKNSALFLEYTVDSLKKEIERIPGLDYKNIFLLKKDGEVVACAAMWDWSHITKITVKGLSGKYKLINTILKLGGKFVNLPGVMSIGQELKQMCLVFYAYNKPNEFEILLRYMNNYAYKIGVSEICLLCDQKDKILKQLGKFIWVNVGSQLCCNQFNKSIDFKTDNIWINGTDI